jgi:hypothetical protein
MASSISLHILNFSSTLPILKPIEGVVAEVKGVMNWKNLLETVSESVNDQLRLRHDYLVAENRILRNQTPAPDMSVSRPSSSVTGRSHRSLKLQFKLDDETLEAVKDELLFAHPAADAEGRGIVGTGDAEHEPAAPSLMQSQDRAPASYTPQHLAEKILITRSAL